MNLNCFKNKIITDNLAIQIDLSDDKSWNLNTDFTAISLSEWSGAAVDNLNLLDFGLTAYDNGRINRTYSGITFTPDDTKLSLYRIGYNTGNTAFLGETQYDGFEITGITGSNVGNYFILNGGYLQGFFKLKDYNYELFPSRYNNGITIETMVYLTPESFNGGIFYLMGTRAEDKYNPFFSGETKQIITETVTKVSSGLVGQTSTIVETTTGWSGVTTSEDNYLISFQEDTDIKKAFGDWATRDKQEWLNNEPIDNIKNNIIAFFLNDDGKIGLKYINDKGTVITRKSDRPIPVMSGWTIITHTFIPDEIFDDDVDLECAERRKGTFSMYINGSSVWKIKNFDEYYFRGFSNDKEKQIGVPFNISWGGGSFGLENSWHYDARKLELYNGQSQDYIQDNWIVTDNPLNEDPCFTGSSGGSFNSLGVVLLEDNQTFTQEDICDPNIVTPITTLRMENTGSTLNQYFVEFNQPIEILSNRDILIKTRIYDTGIFNSFDQNNNIVFSQISLVPIGTEDINIVNRRVYQQPIVSPELTESPFPIKSGVYEYVDGDTGLLIEGETGFPVDTPLNREIIGDNIEMKQVSVGGANKWVDIYTKFNIKENTQRQLVKVGLLIESDIELVDNFILFIDDFIYLASDNLNQDSRKQNLLIQQNFNTSFIGGIQKLRLYDKGFSSQEVLHNAKAELNQNPNYGYTITKGGRLIFK